MSKTWNQLLYWLTAQGQGSKQNFSQACQTLGFEAHPDQIRRDLQLLGHLEVQPGARRWSITRPCWIQTAQKDTWFWTGERVPHLIPADLDVTPQANAPDRLSHANPPSELPRVGCTSEQLLNYLPDLAFWREHLVKFHLHHPLGEYQFEYWNAKKREFIPLTGVPPISDNRQIADYQGTGVYRLKKKIVRHPMDQYAKILYWDGSIGQKNWLVADLIGLRFAHFYDNPNDDELTFVYHSHTGELWIPEHQRWPYIYERCLVLASGFLPTQASLPDFPDTLFLKYVGIPPRYVEHFESLTDSLKIESLT